MVKFALSHLVTHLQPFDGYNTHNVVKFDDAFIHHTDSASTTKVDRCFGSFPTPTFSRPIPIEEAFSKVKTRMKQLRKLPQKICRDTYYCCYKSWINDSKACKQF